MVIRLVTAMGCFAILCLPSSVLAQPESLWAYRESVQADNPSGFWYLDETSGTTAADASSVGGTNDGSWVPGISTMPGFIAGSNAYNSTGNSDWVTIPGGTFTDNSMSTQEFTIEHWVNPNAGSVGPRNTWVRGFFFGGGCCTAQFLQENSGGQWSGGINGGGGGTVTASLTEGEWSHVVMTAKPNGAGTDLEIFVNGASVGTHTAGQLASDDTGEDMNIGVLEFSQAGQTPYSGTMFQGFKGGIDEVAYYPYALTAEQVAAHYIGAAAGPSPVAGTWFPNASGSWHVESNWSMSNPPDDNTETATFGSAIQYPRTVFTENLVTVRSIVFDNSHQYVVAGNFPVSLDAGTASSNVNVLQGTHAFQTAVNLVTDVSSHIASGSSLEFVNRLNLNGNTLTKSGAGNLVISNKLNTGAGGAVIVSEGVLSGGGSVAGDLLNNGGTVSPGTNLTSASQVPEPSALVLFLLTLVGTLAWFKPQHRN